jgi:hypothetical protein
MKLIFDGLLSLAILLAALFRFVLSLLTLLTLLALALTGILAKLLIFLFFHWFLTTRIWLVR